MYNLIVIPVFCLLLAIEAKGPGLPVPPAGVPSESSSCLPSLPVFMNHPGPKEAIGNGVQAIFSSLKIECIGHVATWRAYTKGAEESTIHFQVWRRVSLDSPRYRLVGENVLTNARPVDSIVTMEVNPDDYIEVLTGDIIGLYLAMGKGAQIKTERDYQSTMWHYKSSTGPSLGIELDLSVKNQLLKFKEEIPIIDITLVQDSMKTRSASVAATNAPQSTIVSQPTPSATSSSNTDQDITQSNSGQQLNEDETNCGSENNSMFLIMVVLVMAIAILLLVVFILGTALVLVTLKLRSAKDSGVVPDGTTSACTKDTYVGKQIVLIEGVHHRRNNNHRAAIDSNISNESIENPSYSVDKSNDNKGLADHDNRRAYNSNSNRNDNRHSINKRPVALVPESVVESSLSAAGRGRTDSSSTTSTRGPNAQEYEDPLAHSTAQAGNLQSIQQHRQITSSTTGTYSHPRHTAGQRAVAIRIPVECNNNVNYIQVPSTSHNSTNQAVVHV